MASELDPCVTIINTGILDTTTAKTRNVFVAPVACVVSSIGLATGTTVTAGADYGVYVMKNITTNTTLGTIQTDEDNLTADEVYEFLTDDVELAAGDVIQLLTSETLASAPANAGAGSLDAETFVAVTYVTGQE